MSRGPWYPWAEIVADLRRHPGMWILHRSMVGRPITLRKTINERRAKPLRFDDGRITTHAQNRTTDDEGRVVADIWLRYLPKESNDEEDQA